MQYLVGHNMSDVLFSELPGKQGDIGVITLNRPKALNALSHTMVVAMLQQIKRWSEASHIKAIVIKADEGKAFCAGGDIRYVYEHRNNQDISAFFGDEYRLNSAIFHCPKPYIALLDGITMGGGAGISIHGSHRVATEKLLFAMPETGIGFFPDIGSSYFLSRLPKKIGFYLGLTGARIDCQDCLALGLVTHLIAQDKQQAVLHALAETEFHQDAFVAVDHVLQKFTLSARYSQLMLQQEIIANAFAKNSVEDILSTLKNNADDWSQIIAEILLTRSPTSLKVTLQELQLGATLDFDACIQMEYRIANRFLMSHDFFEGIRAVVVDKDQNPHWQPKTLAEVRINEIQPYFAPLKNPL